MAWARADCGSASAARRAKTADGPEEQLVYASHAGFAGVGAGGGILDAGRRSLRPGGRCQERREKEQEEARSKSVHDETLSVFQIKK
jgi:hypothetical protein